MPGVEVFGTPATGGAVLGDGEPTLDPVVPVPVDGLGVADGTDEPGGVPMVELFGVPIVEPGLVKPGLVVPGLGVAPRLDPAGPLVPPAVCAFATPVSASRMAMTDVCIRMWFFSLPVATTGIRRPDANAMTGSRCGA